MDESIFSGQQVAIRNKVKFFKLVSICGEGMPGGTGSVMMSDVPLFGVVRRNPARVVKQFSGYREREGGNEGSIS